MTTSPSTTTSRRSWKPRAARAHGSYARCSPPQPRAQLKAEILAAAGAAETDALEALSYTSQVVAGTNFRVKLKVGGKEVTAQIFRPLPHTGEPASLKECA